MQLNEAIPQFLLWLLNEKGYREATFTNQQCHIRFFADWFGMTRKIEDITTDTIGEYRVFLRRQTSYKTKNILLPTTIEEKIKVVKRFLEFCLFKDIPAMNPQKVILRHEQRMNKVAISEEQLDALLCAPDVDTLLGVRDRAIMELFYSTGCRLSEVIVLRKDQVDWNNHQIRLKGKGARVRTVFLSLRCIAWLHRYLDLRGEDYNDALFTHGRKRNARSTGWMGKRSIYDVVKKYAKKAGLPKWVTVHTLRHTYATHLLKKGAQPYEVKELMGHQSFRSTEFYLHLMPEDVRPVHNRIMNT